MFSLRVHTVDSPADRDDGGGRAIAAGEGTCGASNAASSPPQPTGANPTHSPNSSKIRSLRGIVHLYRAAAPPDVASASSSSSSLLPAWRGTLLFVLYVPSGLSVDEFRRFCGPCIERSEIQVIRNDAIEDRYSVVIKCDDQSTTDLLYNNINGWNYPSSEVDFCHILFLVSMEYTESIEIANTPPAGFTELPTCPVCLERLDQDITGIVATTCDHSYKCSCLSKWVNSSCMVCQFCQPESKKPACSICGNSEELWICVICGFVGCGRYKGGHARKHWEETKHCYSLDMKEQQVWDYVGDSFVHRLNQSKSDGKNGKLDKMKTNNIYSCNNWESCECSGDSGINAALVDSKVEAIKEEYAHLLESELENQRLHYEARLLEEMERKKKYISESLEKAMSLRLQDMQLKLESSISKTSIATELNKHLVKNENIWRKKVKEAEEREKATLRVKDEKIHDLEEQIRDVKFFLEAQNTLGKGGADEIRGGTILPVPTPEPSTNRAKKSSKKNRKRN